jgi:hypothetical protein
LPGPQQNEGRAIDSAETLPHLGRTRFQPISEF